MLTEPTFSISDAQRILGKEKSTIYRMIKNNQLKTLDIKPLRVNIMQVTKCYVIASTWDLFTLL